MKFTIRLRNNQVDYICPKQEIHESKRTWDLIEYSDTIEAEDERDAINEMMFRNTINKLNFNNKLMALTKLVEEVDPINKATLGKCEQVTPDKMEQCGCGNRHGTYKSEYGLLCGICKITELTQ